MVEIVMADRSEAHAVWRDKETTASIIGDSQYAQLRLSPRPGHNFYLHLRDLLTALEEVAGGVTGHLLDYGCGSSPYRSLFPNTIYRRADYTPGVGLDYLVGEDQSISEYDAKFDVILSTQVLEHVRRPQAYLSECFRLLKPGGQLVLSTHGLFEEHGCPYDFRRWTADGLKEELTSVGFEVRSIKKLTTGPRAAAFFFRQYGGMLADGRRTMRGLWHWFFFRRTETFFARMDRRLDRESVSHCVVDAGEDGHALYIALLIVGTKPA